MALFGWGKKDSEHKSESKGTNLTAGSTTIVTKGIKVEGNFSGHDIITIDGTVVGNVTSTNNIIISKNGSVMGDIKAPKVVSSGKVQGHIICDHLEVLKSSTVTSAIKAKTVVVYGRVEGQIESENVSIEVNGLVKNKIQALNVNIGGIFEGEVASHLLVIKSTGVAKGGIFVKNISNDGGRIEGAIGQFKEIIKPAHNKKHAEL